MRSDFRHLFRLIARTPWHAAVVLILVLGAHSRQVVAPVLHHEGCPLTLDSPAGLGGARVDPVVAAMPE